MMDETRQKGMPIFIFLSMLIHALLFLYAPQLVAGLIPGFHAGDQGGLTYVTIVDVITPEPPKVTDTTASDTTEPPAVAEQPEPVASVEPTPADEPRPIVTEESPPAEPERIPVPMAELTPVAQPPQVQSERIVTEQPTLVAQRGEPVEPTRSTPHVIAAERPEQRVESVPTPGRSVVPVPEEGERPVDEIPEQTAVVEERTPSTPPEAQVAEEPVLPPTGVSMTQTQGGFIYPKQAVDFLRQSVTVEVATIVDIDGNVLEVIVVESSGIGPIDDHATALASRGITYSPHDAPYELRVHVTYNHQERSLTYRVGEFIQSPPTIGEYAL